MSDARPPEDEFEPEDEEQEELEESPRASDAAAPAPRRGRQAPEQRPRATGTAADEELPYVDDRASKIWVAAIVAVFALILAYGLLFGKAGMLTPATPSPSPSPTAAPTVTATPAPSGSITPAPSVSITPAPSGSITPAPSGSATPAPSVTASPPLASPTSGGGAPTPVPSST